MRRGFRAGAVALALTGGSLVGLSAQAQAAAPAELYVRGAVIGVPCSDTGPGSAELPFCSIGAAAAAATAGQTVNIGPGNFRERVTVSASGTPDAPIIFRAGQSTLPALVGPTAGFVVDGQHDIKFEGISVREGVDVPALDFRNAARITYFNGSLQLSNTATAPAIQLSAVTDSYLSPATILGRPSVGITMDAATSGVTIRRMIFSPSSGQSGVGIRVNGRGNKVLNTQITNYGSAIVIEPEAADTVVANNNILSGTGVGIHNRGAAGTAITNNNVQGNCLDGIRVDGASTGVSVQNNLVYRNGSGKSSSCASASGAGDGVQIGLYDGAAGDTVVDYNNVFQAYPRPAPAVYAAGGNRMSPADFRATTGQAAHDRETDLRDDVIDSANSAAPGYPEADRWETARADDPGIPNTGAGPVTYADRGAHEIFRSPWTITDVTLDLSASTVRVDASTSIPGHVPISSYEFDFGDGTVVTQASPIATHRYAQPGEYTVSTKTIGADGQSHPKTDAISILPVIRTVGLLALQNLRYVKFIPRYFDVTELGLTPEGLFDIADAGAGQVALLSRGSGRYVTVGTPNTETTDSYRVQAGATERFTLGRNADGSISLCSVVNGRYIGLPSAETQALFATRSTITTMEKFHEVRAGDAARTLKAHANGKFVSAESAGTKPLIASRPAANTWEQFDIIDLGNGQVALFARANNRFVAAESAGTLPLKAGRLAVGGWERFTMIRNSDGSVSFKAAINSKYVAAESAGTQPLLAGRTAISTWEKFTLG